MKTRFRLARLSRETIAATPEMALRWLNDNPHNRPLDMGRVRALQQKILGGGWRANPPIEVLESGRLWNGQHRLSAIVRAGRSVELDLRTWRKVPVEIGPDKPE